MKSASCAVRDGVAGCNLLWGRLGSGHRLDHRHGERSSPAPPLPAPHVVVTSPERGITRKTVTNSAGEYNESALPPGTYDVIVTATGFKKFQAKGVTLDVAREGARRRFPRSRRHQHRSHCRRRQRGPGRDAVFRTRRHRHRERNHPARTERPKLHARWSRSFRA